MYYAYTSPIASWPGVPGLENILDTEPDEFTFTAPGLSGRFLLNAETTPPLCPNATYAGQQDCRWQVQCDRSVKVELLTVAEARDMFQSWSL